MPPWEKKKSRREGNSREGEKMAEAGKNGGVGPMKNGGNKKKLV